MTQEQKAKKYDEALEWMKKVYPTLTGVAKEDAEHYFPELRKSEDERIIHAIIDALYSHTNSINLLSSRNYQMEDIEAWLEKQKELGIQWFKSDNVKNPDKPYIDKAGMFYTTDGRMCYASEIEKQKEQKHYWKPTETDVALFNKAVTTNKALTPAERAQLDIIRSKFGYCRATNCSGTMQKEQKLVEKENTLTDFEEVLNTFLFDFANSPIEDYEPKEYIKKHSAEILKAAYKELNAELQQDIFEAKQEGIREGDEVAKAEQKSAEWSEEDERMRIKILEALSAYADHMQYVGVCNSELIRGELMGWLNSLRPSWKPSEGQMQALSETIAFAPDTFKPKCTLVTLQDDLKKLMNE